MVSIICNAYMHYGKVFTVRKYCIIIMTVEIHTLCKLIFIVTINSFL